MQVFEFEGFILDNERRELRGPGGQIIVLKSKAFDTLSVFLANPGRILSKEDLMDRVWPDVTVEENNLNQTISMLRRALGDNRETPRFIQTVPRQGYLFMPQVQRIERPSDSPGPAPSGGFDLSAPQSEGGDDGRTLPPPLIGRLTGTRFRLTGLVVGLAVAALVLGLISTGILGPRAVAGSRQVSIAVLPFENLGPETDKDYFARGVSVEIIDILSQLDGLDVIDRNSSFAFGPGADARHIGKALAVSHVLSGAVRTDNGRVRISAQLASARTGKQVWTRVYERELSADNLFAVQRLIARNVSGAMSIAFDVDARERFSGAGTRSLEAYDYYLRGYDMWFYGGTDYPAPELFQRAIDADPNYAAAWAGKAFATLQTTWQSGSVQREREALEEAMTLARRSVELDPDAAAGHAVLGVCLFLNHDWIGARSELDQAMARSRNQLSLAHMALFQLRTGRLQDALDMTVALREVDPLTNPLSVREDVTRAAVGDYAFGLAETARMLEDSPLQYDIVLPRLVTQINAGAREADIRDSLARIAEGGPKEPAQLAADLLEMKSRDAIRERLRREHAALTEYSTRDVLLAHLAAWARDADLVMDIWRSDLPQTPLRAVWIWGAAFSDVRQRADFRQLMRDIHLVDYWEAYGWPDRCRPATGDQFSCQ